MLIEFSLYGTKNKKIKSLIESAALAAISVIPKARRLKLLRRALTPRLEIGLISNSEMKSLNKKYRGKNKPTDVLSFSRVEFKTEFPSIDIGEVLIATDVAKKQAPRFDNTYHEELARLTVHGVLHIFGYDHERSKKEEKVMFRLQDKALKVLSSVD